MESPAGRERMKGLYLLFHLDESLYGLPVSGVREILPMVEITPVPNAPPFIRGVVNLRGSIVPIIDLRRQLRLPEREPDARSCLVVGDRPERAYGFIADRVTDCLEIDDISHPEAAVVDLPPERQSIHGIGQVSGKIVILLDPIALLSPDDWRVLSSL